MGKKVICYIQAFDCESTIAATMQSVLEQTYPDWFCFVLSNGNGSNHSLDVIKGFAARDKRFVVLNKKCNLIDMYLPSFYHLASMYPDAYICSIDADDRFERDFFERAITLAEKHHLDIVACGTEILLKEDETATEERLISRRALEEDLIIKGEGFVREFIRYRSFFNEMWGKLYQAKLFLHGQDWDYAEERFFKRFLPDTLFTFDNLSRSRAIGILSGTSHKFYQFEQRKATNATVMANVVAANAAVKKASETDDATKEIQPRRPKRNRYDVYYTYDVIMTFLHARGEISEELYEYMQAVLFGWLGDIYSRTLLLTTDEDMLAEHVRTLVFHPKFDELMRYRGSGKYRNLKDYTERKDFCMLLRNTLAYQPIIRNRDGYLECSEETNRKLEQLMEKLDATVRELSDLQAGGTETC